MTPAGTGGPAFRALVMAAAAIIVIAGLKAASPILLPVLVAAFVTVLSVPPITWMARHGLPRWAAAAIVFVVVIGGLVGLSVFVGLSLRDLGHRLPEYQAALSGRLEGLRATAAGAALLDEVGLDGGEGGTGPIGLLRHGLSAATSLVEASIYVFITATFMLAEAAGLPDKLKAALGADASDIDRYDDIIDDIQGYLAIKTQMAAAAGVVGGGLCWAAGVDYPGVWGLLAGVLYYVPVLGPLVATLPPAALAFVQHGTERALLLGAGCIVTATLLGKIIEPRRMGRRLGLSALVVFLSVVFWGFVWGPVGMVLCVPLTMVVKIVLQNSASLRWAAVLLGSGVEAKHVVREARRPGDQGAPAQGSTPS